MQAEWKRSLTAAVEASIGLATQGTGSPEPVEVDVVEVEGPGVWARVPLRSSIADGMVLEPFVLDAGPAAWMQAWADGRTLTVAAGLAGSHVALAFAKAFLGVADSDPCADGDAVPDRARDSD